LRFWWGAEWKRGIDIQLATAETALSFLHYIPNLTNTNQTRLEIKILPRPTNRPCGLGPTAHLSIYIHTQRQKGYR
jgi:hypothetical protein